MAGQYVGLAEVGDGLWDAYFRPASLKRIDVRKLGIEAHRGRWIGYLRPLHYRAQQLLTVA